MDKSSLEQSFFEKNNTSFSERLFIAELFKALRPKEKLNTKLWAETNRIMSSIESSHKGKFNCMLTPWMLYVMECLDNPKIPIIVGRKSAQIAWTETMNNHRAARIHLAPCKMIVGFSRAKSITKFYKQKWKPFYKNNVILSKLINQNVPKESQDYFIFPGGDLSFVTLGAIADQKSTVAPYQEVEEPDDVPDNVAGQGDSFSNFKERQKTFKKNQCKLVFGGTPTTKYFSRVDAAYEESNQLVYLVPCHECGEFHELSFDNLKIEEYPNRYIDPIYGSRNPESAFYQCPNCKVSWTFEQKNINVKNAINFHNKGWLARKPEIKDIYGFAFNELLSPFEASNYNFLAKDLIKAEKALLRGDESPMKSFINNKAGKAYSSKVSALETDSMIALRKNYPEDIAPMEVLIATIGIDVQENRFAYIIRGWGRNGNSWLIKWSEIWGNVMDQRKENGHFIGVWGELTRICLQEIPHIAGGKVQIYAGSIDAAFFTDLVYHWVNYMQQYSSKIEIRACKGVKELKYSPDEVYTEPSQIIFSEDDNFRKVRKSLAETMGVTVFQIGAHRAHQEILNRINLNLTPGATHNVYYFNEQSYGQYEEQMTSCKQVIDSSNRHNVVFKLIPGRRKEAIDGEKLALHANHASGIRLFSNDRWLRLEKYLYNIK